MQWLEHSWLLQLRVRVLAPAISGLSARCARCCVMSLVGGDVKFEMFADEEAMMAVGAVATAVVPRP